MSKEEDLSIFAWIAFAKSALIYKIIKSMKSKLKKKTKWGWQTVKLQMIEIKQLLTHLSSKNQLIWVAMHLDSLLQRSILRASFKVSTPRFFMIFRNLNLAQLVKTGLKSKKKGMPKGMRRLSSPKSFMWMMSRLTFWCLSLKKNRIWQLLASLQRLLNFNLQFSLNSKFKK